MIVVKSIITILFGVLYYLLYYLALPTLSLGFVEGFLFIGLGVIIVLLVIALWLQRELLESWKYFALPVIVCGVGLLITVSLVIASMSCFHASKVYHQIGDIETKSFKNDVVEIDTTQIPVVDLELAAKLADKKLGEDMALGSQVEVGTFTNKQNVNGKLVYVAPLEHSGFFKWYSNRTTPGYVIVSATNPNDVELVRTLDDGSNISLKYLSSSCFGDNLKRHLRNSGYKYKGLIEYSFELDDSERPYWVVTTYKNTTIWGNPEATGVVVCDAQTGECNWYSVSETPDWVDIVQPESFVTEQIKNYGRYVHGFWNLDDKDELSMTEHITTVYNDGDCYYYTGLSSVGKDNGTVGFIMVNTRDKSAKLYKMVGATEDAAMRSAEGKVQNMGYIATTPIPLNVSGIPAYFCTLKDDEGLVKSYAMLKIEDYSIVATGSTIAETKRSFINAVNNSGTAVDFGNGEVYGYTLEGTVSRIGYNIESGDTYYYMILNNDTSKLYLASYMISEELPITREGDKVKVSYIDEANGTINLVTFDNLNYTQQLSEGQEKINREQESQNIINSSDSSVIDVNPEADQKYWDSLTDEEKARLLEGIKE